MLVKLAKEKVEPVKLLDAALPFAQYFFDKCILKEIKYFIGNWDIEVNLFRVQACDLIKCEYSRTQFIHFMFNDKRLVVCL